MESVGVVGLGVRHRNEELDAVRVPIPRSESKGGEVARLGFGSFGKETGDAGDVAGSRAANEEPVDVLVREVIHGVAACWSGWR